MSTLQAAIGKRHFGRGLHDMVYRLVFAGLLLSATATSRALPSIDPKTVEIRSGALHLKAMVRSSTLAILRSRRQPARWGRSSSSTDTCFSIRSGVEKAFPRGKVPS
jgi:hypothetical protein